MVFGLILLLRVLQISEILWFAGYWRLESEPIITSSELLANQNNRIQSGSDRATRKYQSNLTIHVFSSTANLKTISKLLIQQYS